MDYHVKVLVIVPVYNTEPYLRKCLDSLIHQTLQEILIMVVNDGTPDNAQSIIDEYIRGYPQKVVGYVTENQGPGMARNFGIEKALEMLGRDRLNDIYLSFADSDDWLESQALEILYHEGVKRNADIVFSDTRVIADSTPPLIINDTQDFDFCIHGFRGTDINDPVQQIMDSNVYMVSNKIFRFSLFNNLRFPAICHEDTAIAPLLFRKAGKVVYLPVTLYNYVRRGNSITGAGGIHLKPDALKVVNILLDHAATHDDEIILQFAMKYYVEILAGYKGKPLDNYGDYESLNNALCNRLSDKAIRAFQDAAVQKIQLLQRTGN